MYAIDLHRLTMEKLPERRRLANAYKLTQSLTVPVLHGQLVKELLRPDTLGEATGETQQLSPRFQ